MDDRQLRGTLPFALDIYRDAMSRFVARTLASRNANWFEDHVLPAFRGPQVRVSPYEWERLEKDLARVTKGEQVPLSDLNAMDDLAPLLGIKRCRYVVEHNWSGVFDQHFRDESALAAMTDVQRWRNMWAHSKISLVDAREGLRACQVVLEQVDEDAAKAIESLRSQLDET